METKNLTRDEINRLLKECTSDVTKQRTLLHPENEKLLMSFIRKGNTIHNGLIIKFIEEAKVELIMAYIKKRHALPEEAFKALLKRNLRILWAYTSIFEPTEEEEFLILQNAKANKYYIGHISTFKKGEGLYPSSILWLEENDHWDCINLYIKGGHRLPEESEVLFILHGDVKQIANYIRQIITLSESAADALYELNNEELIEIYDEEHTRPSHISEVANEYFSEDFD